MDGVADIRPVEIDADTRPVISKEADDFFIQNSAATLFKPRRPLSFTPSTRRYLCALCVSSSVCFVVHRLLNTLRFWQTSFNGRLHFPSALLRVNSAWHRFPVNALTQFNPTASATWQVKMMMTTSPRILFMYDGLAFSGFDMSFTMLLQTFLRALLTPNRWPF